MPFTSRLNPYCSQMHCQLLILSSYLILQMIFQHFWLSNNFKYLHYYSFHLLRFAKFPMLYELSSSTSLLISMPHLFYFIWQHSSFSQRHIFVLYQKIVWNKGELLLLFFLHEVRLFFLFVSLPLTIDKKH